MIRLEKPITLQLILHTIKHTNSKFDCTIKLQIIETKKQKSTNIIIIILVGAPMYSNHIFTIN